MFDFNRHGIALALMLLIIPGTARTEEIAVGRFSGEGLADWKPKSFQGVTDYRLVKENSRTVVRATSHASASGLIKKITFDPKKYRYLRWSWKIRQTVVGGDEKTKAGDDYAARVYIVFPGKYFWQMRAVNYIWANKLTKGDSVSSPYSANSKMVAVESGNGNAGQWVTEERDLFADYRRMFGADPPESGAIAIMTDTDNTGGSAEAWYGDIVLSTER